MNPDFLRSAKDGKLKSGKKDLINHLEGKRLTRNQAIKAKCYDCNGLGELDLCDIENCPLYPFSPYSKKSRSATFTHPAGTK